MPQDRLVADHYEQAGILTAIRQGLARLGKTETDVTLEELGPVEEFHIGGRQASVALLDQLALRPEEAVLDVGCGLGGAARFAASRYGCRITGVDLTREFVETGEVLNGWLGLADRIDLRVGSALAMPFADASYDAAYLMHVGMNVADKAGLMDELYRVLKPGGRLAIYDIMRTAPGTLTFPVPWAGEAAGSVLGTIDQYRQALAGAGFTLTGERNRHDFALAFFDQLEAARAQADGAPPLGLHILMGPEAPQKLANMVTNVRAGRIAPVELFAAKAG